ncbi:RNA polymerase sigma factor (sigma-70 family) [Pseudomonas sp. F-14 TE3623]
MLAIMSDEGLNVELNNVQKEVKVAGATHMDLGEVVKGSEKKLRFFIMKRVFNRADVDDLMQMTYLEALRNQHKFLGASKPETWLFGIARNLVSNYFKRMYNQPQFGVLEELAVERLECGHDPSHVSEHHRVLNRTMAAIDELSMEMRTVINLVVDSDITYQDAAERLGIPIGTVRSRIARARDKLKMSVYAGRIQS